MIMWNYIYRFIEKINGLDAGFPPVRQLHPAAVRSPAGRFRRGTLRGRSGPTLRLHRGQLSRPGPSFPPKSKATLFLPPAKGPQAFPKSDPLREKIIALRKQNLSIYDISRALQKEGHAISPVTISIVLKAEGFARLPRRRDEERPANPPPHSSPGCERLRPAIAKVLTDLKEFRFSHLGIGIKTRFIAWHCAGPSDPLPVTVGLALGRLTFGHLEV